MKRLHLGALPTVVVFLVILWLASQAVFQVFVADAPKPAFFWLNGSNISNSLVVAILLILLINTNTRRPEGFDPNLPDQRRDPFGEDTRNLPRMGVEFPDGRPYGRRRGDDLTVVKRLEELKEQPQVADRLDLEPAEPDN